MWYTMSYFSSAAAACSSCISCHSVFHLATPNGYSDELQDWLKTKHSMARDYVVHLGETLPNGHPQS